MQSVVEFDSILDQINCRVRFKNQIVQHGMPSELYEQAITSFKEKISKINIYNYIDDNPFYDSGQALYKWSPVADDLKILDKEIVLNSIKNKWNTVINEFNSMSSKFNN